MKLHCLRQRASLVCLCIAHDEILVFDVDIKKKLSFLEDYIIRLEAFLRIRK